MVVLQVTLNYLIRDLSSQQHGCMLLHHIKDFQNKQLTYTSISQLMNPTISLVLLVQHDHEDTNSMT